MNLKIAGIYDLKSIKILEKNNFYDFSFDFHPKSFNFIQLHLAKNLARQIISEKIYLSLEGESDLIIKKIVSDLNFKKLILEIDVSQVKNIKDPFIVNVNNLNLDKFEKIVSNELLYGVNLDYTVLFDLYNHNKLNSFIINFLKIINSIPQTRKKIQLILKVSFKTEVFKAVIYSLNFNQYNIKIDQNVESGYRQISQKKLEEMLNYWRNN